MPRKKKVECTCCEAPVTVTEPGAPKKKMGRPKKVVAPVAVATPVVSPVKEKKTRGPRNMGKVVMAAWGKTPMVPAWPPAPKDKVRMYSPALFRGKKGKVLANEHTAIKNVKVAPKDKVRVECEGKTLTLSQKDVFPGVLTLKDLV